MIGKMASSETTSYVYLTRWHHQYEGAGPSSEGVRLHHLCIRQDDIVGVSARDGMSEVASV